MIKRMIIIAAAILAFQSTGCVKPKSNATPLEKVEAHYHLTTYSSPPNTWVLCQVYFVMASDTSQTFSPGANDVVTCDGQAMTSSGSGSYYLYVEYDGTRNYPMMLIRDGQAVLIANSVPTEDWEVVPLGSPPDSAVVPTYVPDSSFVSTPVATPVSDNSEEQGGAG